MRKRLLRVLLLAAFVFAGAALAFAAEDDVKPVKVKVEVNEIGVVGTYDGLLIRVNQKDDEFFSHSYFIKIDDLKKLAEMRKKDFRYDHKTKKLKIGDRDSDVVMVDHSDKDLPYGTVQIYVKDGKTYFNTWDVYPGLGFSSISRMSDGVYFYDPELEKEE